MPESSTRTKTSMFEGRDAMRRGGSWPRVGTTGWTGGQYSLFRVVLGGYLAGRLVMSTAGVTDWGIPALAVSVASVVALTLFVFGFGFVDRVAALFLGYAIFRFGSDPAQSLPLWAVLLVHVALPPAPYGSWPSRKRNDPRGGWGFPVWLSTVVWIGLAGWYLCQGFDRTAVVDWGDWIGSRWLPVVMGAVALLFGPRPALWGAVTLTTSAFVVAGGLPTAGVEFLLLHVVAFQPAWIPPPQGTTPETVFFDGECGLCHRFVRFLLAEDAGRFRFAPLQGQTIRTALTDEQRAGLPDSLVVLTDAEDLLVRSRGALHVLGQLGGLWTVIAVVLRVVPIPVSDAVYDGVARVRKRVFRQPSGLCPLVGPDLRERLLE